MNNIGIVGSTGLIGTELLHILVRHGYNIKICASDKNIGNTLELNSKSYVLKKLDESFFDDMKIVFFCSDSDISKKWIPVALEKRLIIIDNSSEFRMTENVPLVIPEINLNLIKTIVDNGYGIIANPNCSTVILCMILKPLLSLSKIIRVDVSTYQAVSGAGSIAMDELENQIRQYSNGDVVTPVVFKSQILMNCFSHNSSINIETNYNGEEEKIINETRKILDSDMEISATCVRIPVMRSHCESVKIVFENPVNETDLIQSLEKFDGVKIANDVENNKFPEPLNVSGHTEIYVGRIRKDYFDKSGKTYHMFICGDQILKGAAWNAFQIFHKNMNY